MANADPRPSEAGHWYTASGAPCYEVERADGKGMRPATLRDARKLGLLPGVSSIIRCAAAPGLQEWIITQNLLAFATLPHVEGESLDARIVRVRADAKAQAEKARDGGVTLHAAIQSYYQGTGIDTETWPYVQGATIAIRDAFGELAWEAECPFADAFNGYGGKIDLRSGVGEGIVLDIKTKEFTKDNMPKGWDEQLMQLAAYRNGYGRPNARCANVFVSTNTPGLAFIYEWSQADLARGWAMFKALLTFWQAKNSYGGNGK